MLKKFSSILISLALLLTAAQTILPFAACADGDLGVVYSSNGTSFTAVPGFSSGTTEYYITLPRGSGYAYIKFNIPDGGSAPTNTGYTNEYHGLEGNKLIGISGAVSSASENQLNLKIPLKPDSSGKYTVPVKNENASFSFTYEDGNGTSRDYEILFMARQPRLTSFTKNASTGIGAILYVGGAAANNDNGTVIDTAATIQGSTPNYYYTIHALGNISKELVGSSMFMLPTSTLTDTQTGTNKTVFSFKADQGGNIIIMSSADFHAYSVYETGAEGWTRVNNGNRGKDYVNILNQSRAYNGYSGVDYLAVSLNWYTYKSNTNTSTDTNYYRLEDPGVDGNLTSSNICGSPAAYFMYRAYKKSFEAGELVTVKGWGHTSKNTAIFVQWYDNANASDPMDIQYSADNSTFTSIPNFTETKYHYSVQMPKNTKFAYVKVSNLEENKELSHEYTSWSVHNKKFETTFGGATGDDLVGTDGVIGSNSLAQTKVPMNALTENGAYKIPIKNEKGVFEFSYKNRNYKINFYCKQPRLTSLTDNINNSSGGVVYVGGGAAYNDNGTVTSSSKTATGATGIRALGNISDALIGASTFMLPTVSATDGDLFSFTADHSGTIVVMSDTEITNPAYASGWTQRNNGTMATNVGLGGFDLAYGRMTKPRTFNDYGNKESQPSNDGVYYYAVSTNWWSEGGSPDRWGYNAYRSYYPGIFDATKTSSSTDDPDNAEKSTTGSWAMTYCYSKTFDAGETVTVHGWGTDNSSEDSAVFVLWDDDVTAPEVSKSSTLFEKSEAPQTEVQSFSSIMPGDTNTIDWNSNYVIAFGSADYSAYNEPDNVGFILYADGERMPRYYQAQNIINGKFGVLIFGLEEGPVYSVKNYIKYGTADPVIQED